MSLINIREVWDFNKSILIINLVVVLLLAVQMNINIFLSKYVINSINEKNSSLAIVLILVSVILQFSFTYLQAFKENYDRRINEEYSVYTQNNLIQLISQISFLEKDSPGFSQKLELWRLYSGKYLDITISYLLVIQMICTSAISIIYLSTSFWFLGLMALSISIFKGWIDFRLISTRIKMNPIVNKLNNQQQYLFGLLSTAETQKEITIFGLFKYLGDKWYRIKSEVLVLNRGLYRKEFRAATIGELISSFSSLLILLITSYLVFKDKLTMGDYVAIPLSYSIVEISMARIFFAFNKIIENQKYINIFKSETFMYRDRGAQLGKFRFNNKICIENLSFTYPNRNVPALKSINLTINRGETIAILGDNAAGKSTLIKLLLGLYNAPHRSITYDGVFQEEIDVQTLWSKCSVVFQDFNRYMLTLGENVGLGDVDNISYEENIRTKLSLVGLKMEYFSKDLQTELGHLSEDSVNLSGGQWQRIALARGLLKNGDLLIFDEPTSALDPLSELEFFELLLSMKQEKTLLIISHRISIASKADKIVMMSEGEIKEVGSPADLIERKGYYYKMWNEQKKLYDKKEMGVV